MRGGSLPHVAAPCSCLTVLSVIIADINANGVNREGDDL
jgi:hypothetical protein